MDALQTWRETFSFSCFVADLIYLFIYFPPSKGKVLFYLQNAAWSDSIFFGGAVDLGLLFFVLQLGSD